VDQAEFAGAANRLGARELLGKASCIARARLPWLLCRRRTVRGVAAYFDLITDDGRWFFGDSFHFGFFPGGWQTLTQALDAHTDLYRSSGETDDVNDAISLQRTDLALYHVVGARDWDLVGANAERDDDRQAVGERLLYRPVRYEDRMELVLAAADVAVCRAGATSVAELAAVGLPAVLVPLPGAPGDHQTANARALSDAGGAVLVPDGELDGARLVVEVDALLAEPDRLEHMAAAAAAAGRRDAGERVADLVEEHAREL